MGALDMPLAAIRMGAFSRWRASKPERSYCCRYCGQRDLSWIYFRQFGWRLTTDGDHVLHKCPNFSKRRLVQYNQEQLKLTPRKRAVKIRPAVIIRRIR